MTDPSYTPTIEQVAEALGDPGIRLSHEVLGGVPSVTLRASDKALVQFVRHDASRYIIAAQCEADALRVAWGAIGVGDAERAGLRRAAPLADFVPTIEQVAEALGEPWAHLAPMQTFEQPGGPDSPLAPAVWWAVCRWIDGDSLPICERTDNDGGLMTLAGPTRADALRAAWAFIPSRQEKNP